MEAQEHRGEIGTQEPADSEVHVKSLVTGEEADFRMPATATVGDTWAEAYVKLGETRRQGDTFRCAGGDGEDLSSRLDMTLAQLKQAKICQGDHFEIRGPSGGA